MSILNQFNQLLNRQEKAIAKVVGQRGGGRIIGKTLGGSTVILSGDLETGKYCFYDRISGNVLSEAPNIPYSEYGV